ncbi:uncharacterized protein V1516DRAFT_686998 [Lipomyces oligophaga]|uniref:uncharacterized protein n=1 Tax=Lipomyces oligophaga TaxID=45792 RepID=UPI0034CD5495
MGSSFPAALFYWRRNFATYILFTFIILFFLVFEHSSFTFRSFKTETIPPSLQPSSLNLPPQCIDPYRIPGHLLLPPVAPYEEARWFPFYPEHLLGHDGLRDPANMTDEQKNFIFPPDAVNKPLLNKLIPENVAYSWSHALTEYMNLTRTKQNQNKNLDGDPLTGRQKKRLDFLSKHLRWLQNKRILIFGDSVDRMMDLFLCSRLGLTGDKHPEQHTVASCHVPDFNFTITHWHVASMAHERKEWWWRENMEYVSFEDRQKHIFQQEVDLVKGIDGRGPDLIIFQSLLWDALMFELSQESAYGDNEKNRLPYFSELEYFRDRFHLFIRYIKDLFNDTPMLYRSAIPRRGESKNSLYVTGLDRMARSVAYHNDIEVFEWWKMVVGFPNMYKDFIHIDQSPLSSLYSDMMLYYLFRASGGLEIKGKIIAYPSDRPSMSKATRWAECHSYNMININR